MLRGANNGAALQVVAGGGGCVARLLTERHLADGRKVFFYDVLETAPWRGCGIGCLAAHGDMEDAGSGGDVIRKSACITIVLVRLVSQGVDISQAGALLERMASDGGDGVGDGDARQASAVVERPVSDGGDGVGDGDARQAGAAVERSVSDGGNGVGDGDARQAGAAQEHIVSDGGDGVGDGDAR